MENRTRPADRRCDTRGSAEHSGGQHGAHSCREPYTSVSPRGWICPPGAPRPCLPSLLGVTTGEGAPGTWRVGTQGATLHPTAQVPPSYCLGRREACPATCECVQQVDTRFWAQRCKRGGGGERGTLVLCLQPCLKVCRRAPGWLGGLRLCQVRIPES